MNPAIPVLLLAFLTFWSAIEEVESLGRRGGHNRGVHGKNGIHNNNHNANLQIHVTAGYPEVLAPGVPPPMLEWWEREPVVKLHNRHRRHLARRMSNGVDMANMQLPGAQRMYKLVSWQ